MYDLFELRKKAEKRGKQGGGIWACLLQKDVRYQPAEQSQKRCFRDNDPPSLQPAWANDHRRISSDGYGMKEKRRVLSQPSQQTVTLYHNSI